MFCDLILYTGHHRWEQSPRTIIPTKAAHMQRKYLHDAGRQNRLYDGTVTRDVFMIAALAAGDIVFIPVYATLAQHSCMSS
jgi:hypothetical protein